MTFLEYFTAGAVVAIVVGVRVRDWLLRAKSQKCEKCEKCGCEHTGDKPSGDVPGGWRCRYNIERAHMSARGLICTRDTTSPTPGAVGELLVEAGYVVERGIQFNDTYAWWAPASLVTGTRALLDSGWRREDLLKVLKKGRTALEAELAAAAIVRSKP